MEFRILGPLEALADGRPLAIPSGQQRALLALLIVHANHVLSPDRIVDDVWGERPPGSGTKALAFHVSRLRDALSPGRGPSTPAGGLETAPGGYVLRVDPDAIDAVRFERLAREAHGRLPGEPATARSMLVEALGLWRGEPLADVAFLEFAQPEIRRLAELRLGALEDLLEADLALGEHLTAIGELEALVASNPLRERLRGLLMVALYRSGREAEALRVAGAGRRLLSEELGIDPSPELVRLESQILAQDPALDLPKEATATHRPRNPYKGLRAFGEADSADFFGREALIGRLVTRLGEVAHAGRLLVVVGPSGSGKSSVVRAGLVPAVRRGDVADLGSWRVAVMVPGAAPFRELAASVAASGRRLRPSLVEHAEETGDLAALVGPALGSDARLLVVIDQLEELFLRVDDQARGLFLGGLVAALTMPGSPLVVVATLRADFLHVPLLMPGLGELLRGGIEPVTPLTRAELERAIVRPAEDVGLEVEPSLVSEMLSDVEHRPGALPLLEYALTELFDGSDGRHLTRDGYASIGGATGALGRRAEEAWQSLSAGGRQAGQQILLGLVTLGDGGIVSGRRVHRTELESLAGDATSAGTVLDDFGRRGLLTFDLDPVSGEPTVQIAHEALLVHWPRLADWIEDSRQDLWTRRRLADTAAEWEAAGRSEGFLSAGAKLDRFEAWARGTQLRLTDTEREYLEASAGERARLAGVEAVRAAREHRLERRSRLFWRGLVAVLLAGVLLTGSLAAALFGTQQAAVEQAAVASARELAAGSVASLGRNPELSELLALEAAEATVSHGFVVEEAYDALQWALQAAQVPFPTGQLAVAVRSAPDGPRGVFLLEPDALMRLAAEDVRRPLSAGECRTYLHFETCSSVQAPAAGIALGVRTSGGVVSAASLAFGPLNGTHVRVLSELPADVTPGLSSFEGESGVRVDWAALGGDLETRIAAGDVPDVAIVSRPSYIASAARNGLLLDLAGRVDTGSLATDAGQYAMGLGLVAKGTSGSPTGLYGIPLAASVDDLLWYPSAAFAAAGYEAPTTRAGLEDLVTRLRADGQVPWCLGTEAGSRSGSAVAGWVEGLFLAANGPTTYDRWIRGEIPFQSPEVRAAFEAFGPWLVRPGDVLNGFDAAALTPERIAALPMVALDPPQCWLFRGSSTDRTQFTKKLVSHVAAVPFPGASTSSPAVLGRLYMAVVFHDRPEVRRFVAGLIGVALESAMSSGLCDAGVLPIRNVALPPDCAVSGEAGRLRAALTADTFRVRAIDQFPEQVAAGFLQDVGSYLWFLGQGDVSAAEIGYGGDQGWYDLRNQVSP